MERKKNNKFKSKTVYLNKYFKEKKIIFYFYSNKT